MNIESAIFGVVMMISGALIGFLLSRNHEIKERERIFKKERNRVMNLLIESLKRNNHYIEQMMTIELPSGAYPSYPLDTVALSFVNFDSYPYFPENAKWAEKFDTLRFELDHINRKFIFDYMNRYQIDGSIIKKVYDAFLETGEAHPNVSLIRSHRWLKTIYLLLGTKKTLNDRIRDLEEVYPTK